MILISDIELLIARNNIVKDYGIPELEKNGYLKSPFKTSWFGEYDSNISGYSYELCRITDQITCILLPLVCLREING